MKPGRLIVLTGMLFSAAAGPAQSTPQNGALHSLLVKDVRVAEIDSTHMKAAIDLAAVAKKTVTLQQIQLCSMRLNGLPVFAEPLSQDATLRAGEIIALPTLYVTLFFRDIDTVEPLRKMVETQNVHVQGELLAEIKLGMVEKLALHTEHPRLDLAVSQDVPVSLGDSPFRQQVELGILSMLDAGMKARGAVEKLLPDTEAQWVRDLEARTLPYLYWVQSSYSVKEKDATYPVTVDALGFSAQPGQVIVPAEMVEPWKYDAGFLSAMKSGQAKIEKTGSEMRLEPVQNHSYALLLSRQDFEVHSHGTAEKEQVVAPTQGHEHEVIALLRRAAPNSLAVLTLRSPAAEKGVTVASREALAQDRWEHAVVFRLHIDDKTGERSVDALTLGARRNGDAIQLTQPVDSAAFGSPIVTPDGVIGFVQDEHAGAFLPEDLPAPAAEKNHP